MEMVLKSDLHFDHDLPQLSDYSYALILMKEQYNIMPLSIYLWQTIYATISHSLHLFLSALFKKVIPWF